MRLLLSTDDHFVKAEAVLHGKVDMRDLRNANAQQLRAVDQVVWSIKDLFYDLTHHEQAALHRRLEAALGGPINGLDYAALSGDLPPELVRGALQRWLPALDAEVTAHRAAKPAAPMKPSGARGAVAPLSSKGAGRWYRDDVDFSIRYQPKGHAGDFMHAWLDRSVVPPRSQSASPLGRGL